MNKIRTANFVATLIDSITVSSNVTVIERVSIRISQNIFGSETIKTLTQTVTFTLGENGTHQIHSVETEITIISAD
ncbi:MAG: hypothetical protein ACFFD4_36605 [Candidatus Odinarchaeota archaeon]